jgi:ERCC4-type nuclease
MPLFNIFKNKKSKENKSESKKPQITADIHEKDSPIFSNLIELGAEINIMPLQVGDFLINNTIIERKTLSDFISSMLSKRLIQQLSNMQQYNKRLLIIEGELNKNTFENSKLNPNSIKGMILSTCLDMNIPIIRTKNSEETSIYLFLLAKRQLKKQSEISLHSRIPKTKQEQKEYILQAFPNIGPTKSKQLLKEFKSLKNIFSSTKEELNNVLKNRAKEFKEILEN